MHAKAMFKLVDILTPIPPEIASRPGNDRLRDSMDRDGQQSPIFVCDHPDKPPPALELVEGFGRICNARALGWAEIWGIKVAPPADDGERESLKWIHNDCRRRMSLKEKRGSAERIMLSKGIGRDETAVILGLKGVEKSRVFSLDLLAPGDLIRLDEAGVIDSIISQIGPISPREAQLKAIDFAVTPEGVELPTRAAFERFKERMLIGYRGRKPGRPAKLHDIPRPTGAVIASLRLRADGDVAKAVEETKTLLSVLERNGQHGMDACIAILRNRGKGGLPAA